MARLKYMGTSDSRELSAADFKKLGVEDQKKTVFPRFEEVEVDDVVAEALTNLGDFEEVKTESTEGTQEDGSTEGENAGELTTAQQDKAEAAARKAAETASSKSDAMAHAEGEDARPQTTDTTTAGSTGPTGSSTSGSTGGRSSTR